MYFCVVFRRFSAWYHATPLSLPQIIDPVTPYVADLNDGVMFPVMFSSTLSRQNDIDILNAALLLAYLEAAFCFYRVRRVFSTSR